MRGMPVLVPTGTAIASLKWTMTGDDEPMAVTFGLQHTGAVPPSGWAEDLTDIAASSGLCAAANMQAAWTFVGSEVRYNDGSGFLVYESNVLVDGTETGASPYVNTAVLVRKLTGSGGRKFRGRWFLPPCHMLVTGIGSNGDLVSGPLAEIQGYCDDFLTDLATGLYTMVLLHSDGVTSPTTVTALQVQSKAATQRRRMRP